MKGCCVSLKVTVYLVDDEPMAIRYLKMLLEGTSLELEVAGTASNGVKAIPEIERLRPDFVFADISMPVMDGLEMAKSVLKQNPAQKIFILTAYKDFEYAKESVHIGVTDYILKNELTEQGLEELIRKHIEGLDQERRQRHSMMETNLRNFFLSDTFPGKGEEWIYQDRPLQRYVILCFAPRPPIILRHGEERNGEHIDSYEIEKSITETEMVCRAFIEMLRDEYCGIFFARQNTGDVMAECRRIAEGILERFEKELSGYLCIISFAVGKFSMLQDTYRRIHSKVEYTYAGTKRIYFEDQIKIPENQENDRDADTWIRHWRRLLEEGELEETDKLLKTHLQKMRESLSVWEYAEKIRSLCQTMETLLQEKKYDPRILNMADTYGSIELLENDLRSSQERYLREQQEKQYSQYIVLAREYIQKNYTRDISSAEIAEAAGISEGHLRRCFKKEMNINIVNYLTDYRLDRAKEQMGLHEANLDEIWKKTGFTSGQYFSYVFKKKEGVTPREYMRRVLHQDGGQQNR